MASLDREYYIQATIDDIHDALWIVRLGLAVRDWPTHLGYAMLATALTLTTLDTGLYSWNTPLPILLSFGALLVLPRSRGPGWLWAGLVLILGSSIAAIFVAPNPPTVLLAFFTVSFAVYYITDTDERLFHWMAPGWLILAFTVILERAQYPLERASGFAQHSNISAGFLLLGLIFALHSHRLRWIAYPVVLAVPFTGSRWVLLLAIAAIAGISLSQRLPMRSTAMLGLLLILGVWLAGGLQVARNGDGYGAIITDLQMRTGQRVTPSPLPSGFSVGSPNHIVPLRMAEEAGILSALAWVGLIGVLLWRRPRFTLTWWMLAAVGAVSLMSYYFWIPLGGVWFLLLGMKKHDPGDGASSEQE